MLYDFQKAAKAINQWKAYIMRSTNQDRAKQDILENLDCSSDLIVMDWAMKFLQMRYCEKQSDWYGKRGLSWHIRSIMSTEKSKKCCSLYDRIRRDWAAKFSSVDVALRKSSATLSASSAESVHTHSGSTRFSPTAKEYLMAKFLIGERTGRKADPSKVEKDMRAVRNPSNEYQFSCTEWLTTSQIQNFFSRLAASRTKGLVGISVEQQEDVECLVEDSERQELMQKVTDEVGLKHPITYDSYENKLSSFNVPMLKKNSFSS